MRLFAFILICSMVFLGLNRFTEEVSSTGTMAEMSCDMDCCCQQGDCCDGEEPEGKEDQDRQCPTDCDCSYEFQQVAIQYHFMTSTGLAPKAVQYGNLTDTYHFVYFNPLFQPPRFS